MLLCTWLCDKCYLTSVPKTWSQGWTGQERHLAFNLGEGLGLPCREGKPQEDHRWEDTGQNRHHLCPLGSLPPALPPAQAFLALICEKIPFHLSLLPLPTPYPYHFHKILPYIVFCLFVSKFIFFNWRIIALQNCVFSAKHQHDSAIPIPPPQVVTEPQFEFPESYSKFPLAVYFIYGNIYYVFLI